MFRGFIPTARCRKYRKDPFYQVIVEDICDVFGAGPAEREKFKALINGVGGVNEPLPGTPPLPTGNL